MRRWRVSSGRCDGNVRPNSSIFNHCLKQCALHTHVCISSTVRDVYGRVARIYTDWDQGYIIKRHKQTRWRCSGYGRFSSQGRADEAPTSAVRHPLPHLHHLCGLQAVLWKLGNVPIVRRAVPKAARCGTFIQGRQLRRDV